MGKKETKLIGKFSELRSRAEEQLKKKEGPQQTISADELLQVVHELHTHQIELELQNEELQLTQIELEKSRKRFSDLYDFAPIGYLTVGATGLIIEANLATAEMLGIERGKLINCPLSAFVLKEDQDQLYRCRRELLKKKSPQQCELRMQSQSGRQFYAQIKNSILPQLDGDSGQYRAILTDISERKTFEEALLQSKKQWEKTFDAMTDIVMIQDRDFHIVQANKAAYQMFHAEKGTLVGRTCYEMFRGTNEVCDECPILKTLHDGKPHSWKIKHERLEKMFLVSSNAMLDDDGNAQYVIHTAKDITESERLEGLLRQKYKMEAVGLMAGGIAHNFNNNLSIILGNIELAELRLPHDSDILPLLKNAMIGITRSRDLVQKILTFSSRDIHNWVPIRISLVFEETLKLLRSTLPSTILLQKDVSLEGSSAIIKADPSQIQEALINLCNNAIHAMGEEGTLMVSLDTVELKAGNGILNDECMPGTYVQIRVQDSGCGMNAKTMEKIFDPFFTTKDVGQGSGMGLSTVKGIVEQYGGITHVQSAVEQGTIFDIYFPKVEMEQAERSMEVQDLSRGTERILFIDDDPLIVQMAQEMLTEMGYSVTPVTESKEALKLFSANMDDFDLIIADQTMPGMTGKDLIQEVKKIKPEIRTILCTGYSNKIDENQAKQLGINAFLVKPVNFPKQLQTIRRVLDGDNS